MFCLKCENYVPENIMTCTVCGTAKNRGTQGNTPPYPPSHQQRQATSHPNPSHTAPHPGKSAPRPAHQPGQDASRPTPHPGYTTPRFAPHPDHASPRHTRQSGNPTPPSPVMHQAHNTLNPASHEYNPPYSASQTYFASPSQPSISTPANHDGKHIPAAIAVIIALLIFSMQMNWIAVSVDVGRLSNDLLTDVISQDDIWEIMHDASIARNHNISDYPYLVDLIDSLTNTINREIREFTDRIRAFDINLALSDPFAFDMNYLVGDPPDLTYIVNTFTDIILWEVNRVAVNMGELNQNISISDLPNLLGLINMITDTIIREGASWGMNTEDAPSIDFIQTAEQAINILRITFMLCTLLLIIFMYLIVARLKAAYVFGQITMFIVFLLSAVFAVAMFVGNRMATDALGDYIGIRASWYVYGSIGLSIFGFVLAILHKKNLRNSAKGSK